MPNRNMLIAMIIVVILAIVLAIGVIFVSNSNGKVVIDNVTEVNNVILRRKF